MVALARGLEFGLDPELDRRGSLSLSGRYCLVKVSKQAGGRTLEAFVEVLGVSIVRIATSARRWNPTSLAFAAKGFDLSRWKEPGAIDTF